MKTNEQGRRIQVAFVFVLTIGNVALGDTFGTGANQFTIDFVTISGDASSANGTNISPWESGQPGYKHFTDPGAYRMGTYEITNGQWDNFKSELGVPVTGSPSTPYDESPYWTSTNVPSNKVSWYEAAQFVNWLNTSTGHQAAYKFTGTQGQSDYALGVWTLSEAAGGTNLYRHKDAFYFLPTEDEWVKAGYWNGTSLQAYATKPGENLHQGDGVSGTGWNYYASGYATDPPGPWDVGSGSEELNGTFDMVGNVWEWMESPYQSGDYLSVSARAVRGGSITTPAGNSLVSSYRDTYAPYLEYPYVGFRVASVPEPYSLSVLALGGLALRRRQER